MAIATTRFGYRSAKVIALFSGAARRFGTSHSSHQHWAGAGFLAGEAPASSDPTEPDGRFRIMNQPSVGRVMVFERGTGICVACVLSKPDGTWRVDRLSAAHRFTVIGFDDRGLQNAAIQDWITPAEGT